MTTDSAITAVLDRIVDGETAVLLLEDDGEVVDERTIDVEQLPSDGAHEGAVFTVEYADEGDEAFDEIRYRPDAERERRDRAQERFDRLSERLSDANAGADASDEPTATDDDNQ